MSIEKGMKANDRGAVPATQIKAHMSKLVRYETYNGKPHIVCPVVMITEGVHNGVFYSSEELAKFPEAWDGRPVPVYHPQNNMGDYTSSNDPKIIEAETVGQIFNTKFENGKLKAEIWLDPEKANEVDEKIMQKLDANVMIEVSTGLFTEDEITEGDWNGETYSRIAHNFRPDHLAILPEQEGACSIADGAGFPRVNEKQKEKQEEKTQALKHLAKMAEALGATLVLPESCQEDPTTNTEEDPQMELKEIVDGLIANEATPFEESDREYLSSLTPERLDTFQPKVNEETPEVKEEKAVTETPEVEEEEVTANEAKTVTLTEKALSELIDQKLTANNEQLDKKKLVNKIAGYVTNQLAKDGLEKLSLKDLEAYEQSIRPMDYTARGAGGSVNVNTDEQPALVTEPLFAVK